MVLTSARNQRGHGRGSYTLAHVAHKVHEAGGSIGFFFWKTEVSGSRERHEQECHRQGLKDAQPCCSAETYKQIEALAGEVHAESHCEPPEGKQMASLETLHEPPNQPQ